MGNIGISTKAEEQLREQLINSCIDVGIGFRMEVSTDNTGEFTYSIRIDRQRQGDKVIDSDAIKVFLDLDSASQIKGYQLDYDNKPESGFFLSKM